VALPPAVASWDIMGRMVEDLSDPRRAEPPYLLNERDMLEQWLEFHRTTLLLKCEDLDDEGRKRRPVPTSMLSLHGLIRHMIDTERSWFRRTLLCEPEAPWMYRADIDDGREFLDLEDADWEDDVAAWLAQCDESRAAAASRELDDTGLRHGEPCSLRWIYVHMIEEYARHNGHADLMRELIDGRVGW
jgi:uncharacterized damage-inducible protein DinB